jgi:hypothetical protein
MIHPIHRVSSVHVVRPYVVRVAFADGLERTIDLGTVLAGEIYGPLRDPKLFVQVKVDPEVHTVVWPNGADFDPATLHDWPDHVKAFERKAQEWLHPTSPRSRSV